MKDGRILEGAIAKIAKLADDPRAAGGGAAAAIRPIVLIDDDLTRTFVPEAQISRALEESSGEVFERIHIAQPVAERGSRVASVGPTVKDTPWDDFGRHTRTMATKQGLVNVIQGITLITPRWTKIEGLAGDRSLVWEMRVATSSIPRDALSRIIGKKINPNNIDDRKRVIRLYLQGDRFQDAKVELDKLLQDFPDQNLQGYVRQVRQINARHILDEINLRRKSGQHQLAYLMLQQFPVDGVAGEILQQVRQAQEQYEITARQGETVLKNLQEHLAGIKDDKVREQCQQAYDEIKAQLNIHTLDRMADYVRLGDDPKLSAEEKFALGLSGWLMGSGQGTTNLPVAISLFEVRDLVRGYLRESVKIKRGRILSNLASQEGTSPRQVARLLANMAPPLELPAFDPNKPGYFELEIPGISKEPPVHYYVQLPPEYNPFRRYPTVVTLRGAGSTPQQQLDWWSGSADAKGNRLGQGARHGYIVISVDWAKPDQQEYEYSAREHAAVLGSLRDACRRLSIDTNRVFLSGHSMGGDAAWDMGLAHPDLWGGVIPIVAVSDKYCRRYWKNAKYVPFYVVSGELDGDKMVRNAVDLDRYMLGRYDVTVVEFQGRGHEHFSDEILRIFDWMGRRQRDFFPKAIEATTMRPWDNFFWWVELDDMPQHNVVVNWPPARNVQPIPLKAAGGGTSISVTSGAGKVTVWLSPELVDLDGARPLSITINGRSIGLSQRRVEPDLTVMLEDARSRGERLHPFWAKVE